MSVNLIKSLRYGRGSESERVTTKTQLSTNDLSDTVKHNRCVLRQCVYLHSLDVGEVAGGDLVLSLQVAEDVWQVVDELLLLAVFSEHRRHLTVKVTHDVRLHLN